ncbi:hypothetical protein C8R44DRAFT_892891 [Mycena epipterygia]|nr:hypothetical protein C8R44DRAFT_892891 [Mycena epipterygia]
MPRRRTCSTIKSEDKPEPVPVVPAAKKVIPPHCVILEEHPAPAKAPAKPTCCLLAKPPRSSATAATAAAKVRSATLAPQHPDPGNQDDVVTVPDNEDDSLPDTATVLIPHSTVEAAILHPSYHWTVFICTTCAVRGTICIFTSWFRVCLACKAGSLACVFSKDRCTQMQIHEHFQSFMITGNQELNMCLFSMIHAKHDLKIFSSLLQRCFLAYEEASSLFAYRFYELCAMLPCSTLKDRFEDPGSVEAIETLLTRLNLTCETAACRYCKLHPAPPIHYRNSDGEEVTGDVLGAESYYLPPLPSKLQHDADHEIGFLNETDYVTPMASRVRSFQNETVPKQLPFSDAIQCQVHFASKSTVPTPHTSTIVQEDHRMSSSSPMPQLCMSLDGEHPSMLPRPIVSSPKPTPGSGGTLDQANLKLVQILWSVIRPLTTSMHA